VAATPAIVALATIIRDHSRRTDRGIAQMNANGLEDPTANRTAPPLMGRERNPAAGGCPPHAWGCPVVMKLDPRSVAWTCAGCGAIATVPLGAPPPAGSPTA
jgi:hypothetical protein